MFYALIAYGGRVPGQRPRTTLAYITNKKEGRIKAQVLRAGKWGNPYWYETEIYHTWRRLPTWKQIKNVKKKLEVVS